MLRNSECLQNSFQMGNRNKYEILACVELAEYYDVETEELLDGERSQAMNKEMRETLDKVAIYEEWTKRKALQAGNLAFASMFVIM